MVNTCEDELVCDLAQTYGIYNYKELSPNLVATLTIGLPDSSRVKMKMSGQKLTLEQSLLALILDDLRQWLWMNQRRGSKRPQSVFKKLTEDKKPKDELKTFDSPEAFEAWRRKKREAWDNG